MGGDLLSPEPSCQRFASVDPGLPYLVALSAASVLVIPLATTEPVLLLEGQCSGLWTIQGEGQSAPWTAGGLEALAGAGLGLGLWGGGVGAVPGGLGRGGQ